MGFVRIQQIADHWGYGCLPLRALRGTDLRVEKIQGTKQIEGDQCGDAVGAFMRKSLLQAAVADITVTGFGNEVSRALLNAITFAERQRRAEQIAYLYIYTRPAADWGPDMLCVLKRVQGSGLTAYFPMVKHSRV